MLKKITIKKRRRLIRDLLAFGYKRRDIIFALENRGYAVSDSTVDKDIKQIKLEVIFERGIYTGAKMKRIHFEEINRIRKDINELSRMYDEEKLTNFKALRNLKRRQELRRRLNNVIVYGCIYE